MESQPKSHNTVYEVQILWSVNTSKIVLFVNRTNASKFLGGQVFKSKYRISIADLSIDSIFLRPMRIMAYSKPMLHCNQYELFVDGVPFSSFSSTFKLTEDSYATTQTEGKGSLPSFSLQTDIMSRSYPLSEAISSVTQLVSSTPRFHSSNPKDKKSPDDVEIPDQLSDFSSLGVSNAFESNAHIDGDGSTFFDKMHENKKNQYPSVDELQSPRKSFQGFRDEICQENPELDDLISRAIIMANIPSKASFSVEMHTVADFIWKALKWSEQEGDRSYLSIDDVKAVILESIIFKVKQGYLTHAEAKTAIYGVTTILGQPLTNPSRAIVAIFNVRLKEEDMVQALESYGDLLLFSLATLNPNFGICQYGDAVAAQKAVDSPNWNGPKPAIVELHSLAEPMMSQTSLNMCPLVCLSAGFSPEMPSGNANAFLDRSNEADIIEANKKKESEHQTMDLYCNPITQGFADDIKWINCIGAAQ